MIRNKRVPALFLAIIFGVLVQSGMPATAQNSNVTVTVNGSPIQFDQPPIERAGRVYVPLRGVFERLGASVVFQNGQINATRGSTTVALNIGSSTATINGQPQQLDSPPFVVGSRTLVPLRFVAQALGAMVDFNNSNQTVVITQPNGQPPPPMAMAPQQPPRVPRNFLRDVAPVDGAQVGPRFVVRGFTRPGSEVHLVATSHANGYSGESTSSRTVADVTAAPDGSFAREMTLPPGQVIDVRIDSRAPDGDQATRTLQLHP
jgi:hypothetical protein